MKVAALIVAAGRGFRAGGELPKQYVGLDQRAVLRLSLATFAAHPAVRLVRTVIHPDDRVFYEQAAAGLNLTEPVLGGAERQDSVRLGLESLEGLGVDAVLIHDAARPFISRSVIDRVIASLEDGIGAVPGLPVVDTLKHTNTGTIDQTIPRDSLWRVQTPQGFPFADILSAHRQCIGEARTDDAAIIEAAGGMVTVVEGDAVNVKLTTAADIVAARRLITRSNSLREARVGSGFDVHAFTAGNHVTLGGIEIPHEFSLLGHSDADVALHAITDALYGAVSAGDIGRHFPPSEARWRGMDSEVFLAHARTLVEALGGRISNIDVTIICEAPRIGPYRSAMIANIARILKISSERVSIKATTTEKLGFTGRREGIAVQATATVLTPMPWNEIEAY